MEPTNDPATAEAQPPLGPKKALLILLAFFGAQVFTGIAIGVAGAIWFVIRRGNAGPEVIAEAQRAVIMPAAILGLILGGLVALGLTWRVFRGARTQGLHSIGWSGASPRDLLVAGLAGAAIAAFYRFGLVHHVPAAPEHHWGPVVQAVSSGGWPRHLWTGLALVIAPPVEEFVYRGVLFGGLSRSWSVTSAGTLVTLLFVASHGTEIWGYPPAMVSVAAVGIAALVARIRTKSLAPAVALHAAYNLVLAASIYAWQS